MLQKEKEEQIKRDRQRKENAENQKREMLAKFKKQREELENVCVQKVPDFTIWHGNGGGVYAIVPRSFTNQSGSVFLQPNLRDKLPDDLKYTIDYVGLCGYNDGKWWLYGRFTDYVLNKDYVSRPYVQDHYNDMMNDGLLRPVIGISRENIRKVDGLSDDLKTAGKELMTKILGYFK